MLIFFLEIDEAPSDLVDLLVHANFYDMAFTVLLKFWKGSTLKRYYLHTWIAQYIFIVSMNISSEISIL